MWTSAYLNRISVVIGSTSNDVVSRLLNNEDVKKGKLGAVAHNQNMPGADVLTISQTDSFSIIAQGDQIRFNYTVPQDARDLEDDPFQFAQERFQKAIISIGNSGISEAAWVGVIATFAVPVGSKITSAATH